MTDRWTIHETADGQFSLRLKSGGNNEILVHSESYTRREDAVRAWKRTRWAAFRAFFSRLVEEPVVP